MSLWDYFKREGPLPDPKGSLARVMPSSAIAAANVEVEKWSRKALAYGLESRSNGTA